MELRKYKSLLLISSFSIFLLVFGTVLESLIPIKIGQIIDLLSITNNRQRLLTISYVLLSFFVGSLLLGFVGKVLLNRQIIFVVSELRVNLLKVMNQLDISKVRSFSEAELMTLYIDDVEKIKDVYSDDLPSFLVQVVSLFVAFFNISKIYWPLAVCLIVIYSFYLFPAKKMFKTLFLQQKNLRAAKSKYKVLVKEYLESQQDVNPIKLVDYLRKEIIHSQQNLSKSVVATELSKNATKLLPRTIDSLGPAIIIFFAGLMVINKSMTVGEFVTIFSYVGMIAAPFKNSINIAANLQQFIVSIKQIRNFYNQRIEGGFLANKFVEKDPPPAEYTVIKGASGIGKTTWLSNYYLSQKNKIETMYVPQRTYIVEGTLKENLFIDVHNQTKFLRLLTLLPPLETKVNNSNGLSTGQRKIVNIIQHTNFDAKLLLLDEVASNLDNNSLKIVTEFFDDYFSDARIIEITHKKEPMLINSKQYEVMRFTNE